MRLWPLLFVAGACAGTPEVSPATRAVVINEVAAAGTPRDWFEMVNPGDAPVDLSDFIFVDHRDDFVRARRFAELVLPPGGRHVQDVTIDVHGFQLGAAEGLWIYDYDGRAPSDHVVWPADASPSGGSYARVPDVIGPFATVRPTTPGLPNRP